jgi:4-hydroxy 2-oxovalerate aldolase
MYENVEILDCTLRDGGHVNGFEFGEDVIKEIILNIVNSHVEIIEVGFLMNVEYNPNKSQYNTIDQVNRVLAPISSKQKYSLMIRPDWYDIGKLTASENISIIRFAFYEKDLSLAIQQAKIARDLGYSVFLNPVNVLGYSKSNLKILLEKINQFGPYGVSIVDTFGGMQLDNFVEIHGQFENELEENIILGVHLHENLSLSFAIAQKFIEIRSPNRKIVIDTSLNGMGRIPGNLCTELMSSYINTPFIKYNMQPIFKVINELIIPIKKKIPWGYSPEYAISALEKIHRSYPEYMKENLNLDLNLIEKISKLISIKGSGNNFSKTVVHECLIEVEKDGK